MKLPFAAAVILAGAAAIKAERTNLRKQHVGRHAIVGSDPFGYGGGADGAREARALSMDHCFVPLTCNDGLSEADCTTEAGAVTLTSILDGTTPGEEAVVPCGECAVVDTTDGSTITIPDGLNVQGMLYVPSEADVAIETTHVFVQGVLKIDPPTTGTVRVRLVGSEDRYLFPHPDQNPMACDAETGCKVGKRGIVIAGGRLDINGLADSGCPAHVKLLDVLPPPSGTSDITGCPFDHDLVSGDGTFDSMTWDGFAHQHGGQATFSVEDDPADGNKYLSQSGRCCLFTGLRTNLDMSCAEPKESSNNQGVYRFGIRYRVHEGNEEASGVANAKPTLQIGTRNIPDKCPEAVDNKWVTCTLTIQMTDGELENPTNALFIHMNVHPSKDVDYDDISFEAVAWPNQLSVGTEAASCWGIGDEILITNSDGSTLDWENEWKEQLVQTVTSVDAAAGTITVSPVISTDLTTLAADPDRASEVAWLSRKVVFEAEGDGPSDENYDALQGGHLMITHTPNVAQHIEGVEIRNFGQQEILGRYPIHFHMSGSVAGSIVRKNVIRESKQRCVVIHGSHDVMVDENVAFDSYGHCYILEDGGETGNTFQNNLGAKTRSQKLSIGSTDNEAATFWITNTLNHFIGNTAAGSQVAGFWFETENIRGQSANLEENLDVNPKFLPLYTFQDNTAHSNRRHGIRTYQPGWQSPEEALFKNIKVYHNFIGLFIHGTSNVKVKNGYFANNHIGLLYFANFLPNIIEDSTFIGSCGHTGIQFSLEPRASQLQVYNTSFGGFSNAPEGCDNFGVPLKLNSNQDKSEYDMPIFSELSFDSNMAYAVRIDNPFAGRNICFEDPDGSMNPSGNPGFFINDQNHMTAFLDEGACSSGTNEHSLFCESLCMRRLYVDTGCCSQKHSPPETLDQMVVTSISDPDKTYTFDKYVRKSGLWYHAQKFDVVLPSGSYSVYYIDSEGKKKLISATMTFDEPPHCADYVTEGSFALECPGGFELNADGLTCDPLGCVDNGGECTDSMQCCSNVCDGYGMCA